MQFFTDSNMQFPLVELSLNQGETVFIQRGSMVYHTPNVTLSTKLNASGSGLGRFVKAVGRSMVSGESSFITQVVSQSNNGYIALAPDSPGQVIPLYLGEKQYRLNDGENKVLENNHAFVGNGYIDIKPDEFEYAFSFDGPYEPAKGLLFNEENVGIFWRTVQEPGLDTLCP